MDLQESVKVTGIVTQGYASYEYWTWIKSYKIKYSDNGAEWIYVSGADGSQLKVSNVSYTDSMKNLSNKFSNFFDEKIV